MIIRTGMAHCFTWSASTQPCQLVIGSLQLNVIAFHAAISACETSCQWQPEAALLLNMMYTTFNEAISACEKGGQRQH
eukprot:10561617-Karenia_brevis.AAC.1